MRVRDQNPTGPEGPDATALLCAFVAVLQAGARFPTNSPRLLDPCRDLLRVMRTQLAQRDRLIEQLQRQVAKLLDEVVLVAV